MFLGFALTQHCNLRCPHCIRDDVATVQSLPVELVRSVLDQAVALYGAVTVSLTGGEPLLHPDFGRVVDLLAERGIPYRFVSNGWHLVRALPALEHHPPQFVRLSLSGADEATHDEVRGRGSFRRVLLGAAVLTSRGIPTSLSLVVDRRTRGRLAETAGLAEALGCLDAHFILPQPVPGSAALDTDLAPEEWLPVRREVERLAAAPGRRTRVVLDYGAPFEGPEEPCDTMRLSRIYVDARGRVATCCQLSEYGFNDAEVVADLNTVSLAAAHQEYAARVTALREASRPPADSHDPVARFPCLRCAQACGKLAWLKTFPQSPWHGAAVAAVDGARLVRLGPARLVNT
jgi:MoaA/NifB/PqqE/SkfB family radical SAM enzyme